MPALPMRTLGRSGIRTPALGLGGAHVGRGNISDDEGIATIHRALELGLTFFDTSPLYGHSERRYGMALGGVPRDSYYLETKIGTHPGRRFDYSADATRWSVDNSMSLLGVDYLDSVLIHDPKDIEDPLGEGRCLDVLCDLKDQGVIKNVGLGCRQHHFHLRAIETGRIDLVLTFLDYTLLKQTAAQDIMPAARANEVGMILGSVLAFGTMAGPDPRTIERKHVDIPRAHAMWQWCERRGYSIRDLALQFALAAPAESIVVVGAKTVDELDADYTSATRDIPEPIWTEFCHEFDVPHPGDCHAV